MSSAPFTDRDRAGEEAASWLVLLADEPGDMDLRREFAAWLNASLLNAELWARTNRAYDLIGQGEPQHREHWDRIAAGPAAPVPLAAHRRSRRRPVVWAAVAALAACISIIALPGVLLRVEADHLTTTAELRLIQLDDGSSARLAPESAIAVAFGDGERQIRLLKGEAFFEVKPDAARPFRVIAGDASATVLGTAFDVRLGSEGTAVGVQRGLVRVDDPTLSPPVSEQLAAGDWINVGTGGTTRGTTPPDDIADWQRGELVARDRSIGDVVDALRPYYDGMILVQADDFAARRVSGIYNLRDPGATLRGLAASHGAVVRQISPWLLIVTPG